MAANQADNLRKGPWEEAEDELLKVVILKMGEGRWDSLAQASGLLRSGKSCRLRWLNYLRPNLKHEKISADEEAVIIQLHQQWGNKWSKIAKMLPGRTDNELKNYWRTRVRKQQSHIRKLEMYANRSMMSCEQEISSNAGASEETLSINGGNHEISTEKIPDKINDDGPFGLDFGVPYSPYETQLSHWLSEFPDGQGASFEDPMSHQATLDAAGHESCDMSQDCFYSLWDS